MKKTLLVTALVCALPVSIASADGHLKKHAAESKAVVQEFFGSLKGALGKSLKSKGPVATIEFCNTEAPKIAEQLSQKHGMKVARTSLKTRNRENAPDAWEIGVLKQFEERAAAGESPANMAHFEVIEQNGKKNFRFMKAIGMPPLDKMPCLKCHGENIDPKIVAKLDELYPDDNARGYKPGQIRGAFTLTKPLN